MKTIPDLGRIGGLIILNSTSFPLSSTSSGKDLLHDLPRIFGTFVELLIGTLQIRSSPCGTLRERTRFRVACASRFRFEFKTRRRQTRMHFQPQYLACPSIMDLQGSKMTIQALRCDEGPVNCRTLLTSS